MATHSSILAWRIPWTEEPGWLQSRVVKTWTQLKCLSSNQALMSVFPPALANVNPFISHLLPDPFQVIVGTSTIGDTF